MGDEKFFALLGSGGESASKWGKRAQAWTPEKFEAAMAAPPGDELRGRLAADLVKHLFQGYHGVSAGRTESFLSLDKGLSALSRHAHDLGYDALILFLDELILWLASHAARPDFVHQEGQKLAKLVESQTPDRPVPIVSFVARQRDLRDLVGKNAPGAEQLNFADALRHWEGRFHTIVLEDRNLPVIAEKRVLRPRDEPSRRELKQAFEQAIRVKPEVLETLLTHEADLEMFRQVYPFSPALVQTLVAVSSVLQRERTALKIMLQLLVEKRATLKVGDLIPCGDLWDMVAHGEEAFSDVMRACFENAKRLYHDKLRPVLEELNDVRVDHDRERAAGDPELARRVSRFDNDDRLVKTLLLSAMVPEVEPLENLTASRLAALNHGTIKLLPGADAARVVLNKLRTWASRVGEIRVGEGPDPVISLQVVGVDTEAILDKAKVYDNTGNRVRKIREVLFASLSVEDRDQMFSTYAHAFTWRGSRRRCDVVYDNVRQMPEESLKAQGEEWKVIIDWPFDDPGHDPAEDHARLDGFLHGSQAATSTLVWLPAFFSVKMQGELGKLVILDHLLRGDNLDQHAQHLSLQDRLSARQILENQHSALDGALRLALAAAYGIAREAQPGTLDSSHEPAIRSLDPSFTPQPPVGATLGQALTHLLDQALSHQFPDHPHFDREVRWSDCEKVLAEVERVARADRGIEPEKSVRPVIRLVANPLGLGHMGEQYFNLEKTWVTHFNRQLAAAKKTTPTVRELRGWMDITRARGLAPEVGNLLILAFAEQTNRSFRLRGIPFRPGLDSLQDEVELPLQPLPEPEEWEEATTRAREVFEIGEFDSALCTAANAAALAGKVQARAKESQEAAHGLVGELTRALASLGASDVEIAEAPRIRTARAVDALLSGLSGREPTPALQHLARIKPETSATAMGTSLARAAETLRALRNAKWDLFDHVAHLDDERMGEAQDLRGNLRKAMEADEYVEALEPYLVAAEAKAIRLLAPRRKAGPGPVIVPKGRTTGGETRGWRTVDQGDTTITAENRDAELARLAAMLRSGNGPCRLVLNWILEREETP